VGSIYYVAYAAGAATFPEERWLWSTVGFTVALSVVVHGILATPVMRRLDAQRVDAERDGATGRNTGAPETPGTSH
jgi:NhaP-type Na+/H+ or K+/H+ antiporter